MMPSTAPGGAGDPAHHSQRLIIDTFSDAESAAAVTSSDATHTHLRAPRSSGSGNTGTARHSKAALVASTIAAVLLLGTLVGVIAYAVPQTMRQRAAHGNMQSASNRVVPLPAPQAGNYARLDSSYCASLADPQIGAYCLQYLNANTQDRFRAAEEWARIDIASCEWLVVFMGSVGWVSPSLLLLVQGAEMDLQLSALHALLIHDALLNDVATNADECAGLNPQCINEDTVNNRIGGSGCKPAPATGRCEEHPKAYKIADGANVAAATSQGRPTITEFNFMQFDPKSVDRKSLNEDEAWLLNVSPTKPAPKAPVKEWKWFSTTPRPDEPETRVPATFLATSHEWDRLTDYTNNLEAFRSIFREFGPSPILRLGGASQDFLKEPPPKEIWCVDGGGKGAQRGWE